MSESDYNFLSDREREFVSDPDSFDNQRAAEVSHQIRRKYESMMEDRRLLNTHPDVWDEPRMIESAVVECVFCPSSPFSGGPEQFQQCKNSVIVDSYGFRGAVSGAYWRQTPDGWVEVRDWRPQNDDDRADVRAYAVCPECRSQAREYVRQHGTVPCLAAGHDAHHVGSTEFIECSEFLTLAVVDLRKLRESGHIDGKLPGDPYY